MILLPDYADFLPWETIDGIVDSIIAEGFTLQQWIPVTERLPDNKKCVLMYSPDGGVAEGCYEESRKRWVQWRWSVFDVPNVTPLDAPARTAERRLIMPNGLTDCIPMTRKERLEYAGHRTIHLFGNVYLVRNYSTLVRRFSLYGIEILKGE